MAYYLVKKKRIFTSIHIDSLGSLRDHVRVNFKIPTCPDKFLENMEVRNIVNCDCLGYREYPQNLKLQMWQGRNKLVLVELEKIDISLLAAFRNMKRSVRRSSKSVRDTKRSKKRRSSKM